MEFEAFKAAHPELVQVCGWLFLLGLVVLTFALHRVRPVLAADDELHHNHGHLWFWLIVGGFVAFVAWITWLVWRTSFWLLLHTVLS